MTQALPSPRRKVTLRLSSSARSTASQKLSPEDVEALLTRAHARGLAPNVDPQVAAVLAAVRLREDIPDQLYTLLAAVLGTIHGAGES
jgi:flagellar biosynthesis protein